MLIFSSTDTKAPAALSRCLLLLMLTTVMLLLSPTYQERKSGHVNSLNILIFELRVYLLCPQCQVFLVVLNMVSKINIFLGIVRHSSTVTTLHHSVSEITLCICHQHTQTANSDTKITSIRTELPQIAKQHSEAVP